jgi:glycosyltransferase involved in cell wall biosynthesis
MKILLAIDYYWPFTPGGSEWSTYYLAKSFLEKGVETKILTPNYGALAREKVDGIDVIRFPNLAKLSNNRSVINPFWQNNPLFFLFSALMIFKEIRKENPDIVHVQGKFLIPGAFLASRLGGKKFVVTSRDKLILCSFGKCFFQKDRYKACRFWEYISKERSWFYENYVVDKSTIKWCYIFLAAIWTRLANKTIVFFAKKADQIIAISNSQKKYLEENGFERVNVIYNSTPFVISKYGSQRQGVLYAGKLSMGKGIYPLLKAITLVKTNQKFLFAGGNDEKEKINQFIKDNSLQKKIKLLGGVDHKKLQKLYQKSKLVVMPSIYPEAFGRVALEALASGTPVVVSDRGGLPEIVLNRKTGIVCSPEANKLAEAIDEVLENIDHYLLQAQKEKEKLIVKFEVVPIKQHLKLYKELLK